MDILAFVFQIIAVIVIGIVALAALLVILLIAVSLMPRDNPLRHLLAAFAKPIGVMLGAGALAVPIEFIPVIDALYDIAALIFVGYSWVQFFGQARELWPQLVTRSAPQAPGRDDGLSAVECFRRGQAALARQNYVDALRWYRLAAERGHAGARKILDEATAEQQQRERQHGQEQQKQNPPADDGEMTRAHALEILELEEGATHEQIAAAYTRLMKQVHPDLGGSNFLAKLLNAARDKLLG